MHCDFADWRKEYHTAESDIAKFVPWRKSGKSIRNMRESRLVRPAAASASFEPQRMWFVRCNDAEHLRSTYPSEGRTKEASPRDGRMRREQGIAW